MFDNMGTRLAPHMLAVLALLGCSGFGNSATTLAPAYFYQLGTDMVPGMSSFDMNQVSEYIACFYESFYDFLDNFFTNIQNRNLPFYTLKKVQNIDDVLYDFSSDVKTTSDMLDSLIKTAHYDPRTFSTNAEVKENVTSYFNLKSNNIDPPELIFFWSLIETLNDALDKRFGDDAPLFDTAEDDTIKQLMQECAPYTVIVASSEYVTTSISSLQSSTSPEPSSTSGSVTPPVSSSEYLTDPVTSSEYMTTSTSVQQTSTESIQSSTTSVTSSISSSQSSSSSDPSFTPGSVTPLTTSLQTPTSSTTMSTSSSQATLSTASTTVSSAETTSSNCVAGSGACFMNAPSLGAHACSARPSMTMMTVMMIVMSLLVKFRQYF